MHRNFFLKDFFHEELYNPATMTLFFKLTNKMCQLSRHLVGIINYKIQSGIYRQVSFCNHFVALIFSWLVFMFHMYYLPTMCDYKAIQMSYAVSKVVLHQEAHV